MKNIQSILAEKRNRKVVVPKFLLFENEDFSWLKILGELFKIDTLLAKL